MLACNRRKSFCVFIADTLIRRGFRVSFQPNSIFLIPDSYLRFVISTSNLSFPYSQGFRAGPLWGDIIPTELPFYKTLLFN